MTSSSNGYCVNQSKNMSSVKSLYSLTSFGVCFFHIALKLLNLFLSAKIQIISRIELLAWSKRFALFNSRLKHHRFDVAKPQEVENDRMSR